MVTTRSATNSPRATTSPRTTRSPKASAPATPTPRKTPMCRTCGLPRKGHTRAGCPTTDRKASSATAAGTPTDTDSDSDLTELEEPSSQLSRHMSSLSIVGGAPSFRGAHPASPSPQSSRRRPSAPLVPEDIKAALKERRRSERAAHARPDVLQNLVPVQATYWDSVTQEAKPLSTKMPGTLIDLTPSGSQQSQPGSQDLSFHGSASFHGEPSIEEPRRAGRPLQRSMSVQERELFIASVAHNSRAQCYLMGKNDVERVQREAPRHRLHTRILGLHKSSDFCVFMGHDEQAVELLYQQTKRTGKISAVAGGAMAGAITTFATLAYS
ncbi:hypothetical protein K523DRAFT_341909 [Schizophyllum commune Tattone D]|nr:hypothetical protein K523DRAFT_341909 [Schizophyllum commune Tattone D]